MADVQETVPAAEAPVEEVAAEQGGAEAPSEEPAAKRLCTEDGAAPAIDATAEAAPAGEAKPAEEPVKSQPVTVGYKTFATGNECYKYFHGIITRYRKNQNLNEVRGCAGRVRSLYDAHSRPTSRTRGHA